MKTVDIVQGLLSVSDKSVWDDDGFCRWCYSFQDHKDDCEYLILAEAAKEYLKLMEGAKK